MRTLKNVTIVAEQPMDNAPPESSKVRRALFQSNTSLNQDSCNPRHDHPLWRRTQATSASYAAEQVPRETQLQQREERENIPPEEENDEMLDAHGNGRTTAKLDKANTRHDYPFKRRKHNNNSILYAINQPDAFNGTSALRLRTLRSSQKQIPCETQLQQGEERETNIPAEEENHDMLDAQGNDSRTTAKLDRANARHDYPFKRRKDSDNSILSAINQPDAFNDNNEARKLSSFIGVLARDPRIMPIDCIDFRKIGEDRVEHIWNIVQGSFKFPEGKEPRQWFRETLDASWRWNKCKLKREKFNGKSVDEALKSRPTIIPEDQWRNAVQFWASTLGQTKDGKEPDKLELFEATHKPKRPETKLDDASVAVLVCYLYYLLSFFDEFFEIVGEDKNGYAKTYGLGVKMSRSRGKRYALAIEREKRIKVEEDLKNMTVKLQETEAKVERAQHKAERAVDWVGRVMGDLLLLKSQLRRGEYGCIEDEEADRSFWQEFEKDFPLYEQGSGEDDFVSDDEDA
ncbi:hypothetical protein Cgig2_024968 [Carnegiea gigantea]|uniref:Uncharacterized protein n=1 Tax=Carnegiea gigantea TaxID=171969 RepID=A0A9Q1JQ02_9CARY|nr:hypothetical protein Cgig2_024968 [Carnegiea gigantea]